MFCQCIDLWLNLCPPPPPTLKILVTPSDSEPCLWYTMYAITRYFSFKKIVEEWNFSQAAEWWIRRTVPVVWESPAANTKCRKETTGKGNHAEVRLVAERWAVFYGNRRRPSSCNGDRQTSNNEWLWISESTWTQMFELAKLINFCSELKKHRSTQNVNTSKLPQK